VLSDFMLGAQNFNREWSMGGLDRTGVGYFLASDCIVHMKSSGSKGETPMVWQKKLGKGTIVVNNNDAMHEKWSRGLFSAEYSLLQSAFAFPVLNMSVFFIDDFPSPIPQGYNSFIRHFFGVDTEYFYTNIWLPDVLKIASVYGLKYTCGIIETYEDSVTPPFTAHTDNTKTEYLGKLVLNEGHELCIHGYNHQSFVLEGFDYKGELFYNQWASTDDMASSMSELVRFQKQLFPTTVMKTYVPPSNVLSIEGRRMLKDNFPEINAIAGIYIDDVLNMGDEFGYDEWGLINIPRICDGYSFDESAYWSIISEINFHFVNTHFAHPDDTLDIERGAEKGWEYLKTGFNKYISWLDRLKLRNMTAQEGAAVVQRFSKLSLRRELTDGVVRLSIGGFYDEAYFLLRVNEGEPQTVTGGSLRKVEGNMYLLKAESPQVEITTGGQQ
jgi:hypothetical protein